MDTMRNQSGSRSGVRGAGLLGAAALVAVLFGCGSPPTAEVDEARAALQAAETAGAEEYTPELMYNLTELDLQLRTELEAQAGKFRLFRSYDRTTELAEQLEVAATETSEQVATTKEDVRQETEALLVEVKNALSEVMALWSQAPSGKGSAADLAALRGDLDGVAAVLTEAETAFSAGQYMEARNKATVASETTDRVRVALQRAVQARPRAG